MFRNLGKQLSSTLITEAVEATYREWLERYGSLPTERLRTEIKVSAVKSRNPGYCYKQAGWVKAPEGLSAGANGKLYLYAPPRAAAEPLEDF